jgi:hypothetical protein
MKRTNEFKTEPKIVIPTVRVKPVKVEEPNIKALAIKSFVKQPYKAYRKRRLV